MKLANSMKNDGPVKKSPFNLTFRGSSHDRVAPESIDVRNSVSYMFSYCSNRSIQGTECKDV